MLKIFDIATNIFAVPLLDVYGAMIEILLDVLWEYGLLLLLLDVQCVMDNQMVFALIKVPCSILSLVNTEQT